MSGADKAFATLQARAALVGMTCTLTAAGNIVLARSGGAWIFGAVDKAGAWLDRLEQPGTEVQVAPTPEGAV